MNFKIITDFINRHDKFIITAHETPDGDAIGSEYAMLRLLQKIGKHALIFNADPCPDNFKFLDPENQINELKDKIQIPENIADYALLILDVNELNNIGNVNELIIPNINEYFIIDHHNYDIDLAGKNFIQKNASSTAEIIFQLLKKMDVEIEIDIANAIFTGIVYDTGSFIYPKTSALTFQIAKELVSIGVHPNFIYRKVFECKSVSYLMLQARVLSTLEFHCNNQVAILTMLKNDLEISGASFDEGRALINVPLEAENVKVSIFFKENIEGILRCSMRSKEDIDVAKIAYSYDGGGHKTAAGFKCSETLETHKQNILNILSSTYFTKKQIG